MKQRPDATRIHDAILAIRLIEKFVEDRTFEEFVNDEELRSAIIHQLMIVGETCWRTSKHLKEKHPEVQWDELKVFRNFIVHEYFALNFQDVWKTAREEMVPLKQKLEDLFRNEYPDLVFVL
jgi:uncharacterized protein with HEPN domain